MKIEEAKQATSDRAVWNRLVSTSSSPVGCRTTGRNTEMTSVADKLKRSRNRFLGKRIAWKREGDVRNTFLGKRRASIGRARNTMNSFLRKQMEADNDEKRNRNGFLGKRTKYDGLRVDLKRSRNKFLGKRDNFVKRSRLGVFENGDDDKRSRNRFLGQRDQTTNNKRSRNKFLGKRGEQSDKRSE